MQSISAATKTTSRSASDGGLARVYWSMGEPVPNKAQENWCQLLRSSQIWGASPRTDFNLLFVWTFLGIKYFCYSLTIMCSLLFHSLQTHFCCCKSVSRVKGLLEAAGAQIVCLGLPVSHRMWGILSGNSKDGFKGRRKWSGDGERGRQDRGRRQTRPETVPCSEERRIQFSDLYNSPCNSTQFTLNFIKRWYR